MTFVSIFSGTFPWLTSCYSNGSDRPHRCRARIIQSYALGGAHVPMRTWFLAPIRVFPKMASRSIQPFLQDFSLTDTQTQRPRLRATSVRIALGRIASMHCMWTILYGLKCENSRTVCALFRTLIFTARCTTVQSAVLRSHVVCLPVCLSVTLVDHDHIGWKSLKLIVRTISQHLRSS